MEAEVKVDIGSNNYGSGMGMETMAVATGLDRKWHTGPMQYFILHINAKQPANFLLVTASGCHQPLLEFIKTHDAWKQSITTITPTDNNSSASAVMSNSGQKQTMNYILQISKPGKNYPSLISHLWGGIPF